MLSCSKKVYLFFRGGSSQNVTGLRELSIDVDRLGNYMQTAHALGNQKCATWKGKRGG